MTLYDRLLSVKDDAYRVFQTKLVPDVPPETILGVRTPDVRAIAKEIGRSGEKDAFLASLPHAYYEKT